MQHRAHLPLNHQSDSQAGVAPLPKMGRRRGTKRRKEDGEQKKEAEQQVGRDPLLRLVAPSPAGSVVALAVGSHLRLVDSR